MTVTEGLTVNHVPAFLRASAWEAGQGGSTGYSSFGWTLARHTSDLLEHHGEAGAVAVRALADLESAICADDEGEIVAWYLAHFPAPMALVPARRRSAFARGVVEAYLAGEATDIDRARRQAGMVAG